MLPGLNWRQVTVVRAYVQWLRQAGLPFGQRYVERTLAAIPNVVARLVALFERASPPSAARSGRAAGRPRRVCAGRSARSSRWTPTACCHRCWPPSPPPSAPPTTRAARWRSSSTRPASPTCPSRARRTRCGSARRARWASTCGGAVARGGLRWSDRREDLRTEVLGLVKAQMVKNTVIVPTGAKGGFVVKNPPPEGSVPRRRPRRGQACYKLFIGALLSLTDNLVDGKVVPPEKVVRHDGDDTTSSSPPTRGRRPSPTWPTRSRSSAGSGSAAPSPRAARSATTTRPWASPPRRLVGDPPLPRARLDVAKQDFTVVGIGDMSGDVFGNGMLLSEHIRLVAAFDHRHVFVDPTPDAAASFAERKRLFGLQRSSWADYNRSRISAGGGVWPRTAKSIPVSEPMRAALGLPDGVESCRRSS